MASTSALVPSQVPFHGQNLFLVEHQEEPFTPMRPIVKGMGMDWKTQSRKLNANRARWGVVILTIPVKNTEQNALCMPVRKLPAFFSSIHPEKVKLEIRKKVILFQNECDDALWSYWSQGKAMRSGLTFSSVEDRRPLVEACNLLVEAMHLEPAPPNYATIRLNVSKFLGVERWEEIATADIPKALAFVQAQIDVIKAVKAGQKTFASLPPRTGTAKERYKKAIDDLGQAMNAYKNAIQEKIGYEITRAFNSEIVRKKPAANVFGDTEIQRACAEMSEAAGNLFVLALAGR